MKKAIQIIFIKLLLLFPFYSEGTTLRQLEVTSCAIEVVNGMNDMLHGVNNEGQCNSGVYASHVVTLDHSCSMLVEPCHLRILPRSLYLYCNLGLPTIFGLFWIMPGAEEHYGTYGLCTPANPVYIDPPSCGRVAVDYIEIQSFDINTNTFKGINFKDIDHIGTPRIIKMSDNGYSKLDILNIFSSVSVGVVTNISLKNGSNVLGYFTHYYDYTIKWKNILPEAECNYNSSCKPVDISCYDNSVNIQLANCPKLNLWYYFNPNGTKDCLPTLDFKSSSNIIQSIKLWRYNSSIGIQDFCNLNDTPFINLNNLNGQKNYHFDTNQLTQTTPLSCFIQIQLLGIPYPRNADYFHYNLIADGFTLCSVCDTLSCQTCIGSFSPEPGKNYIISAWVREDEAASTVTGFSKPNIDIEFNSGANEMNIFASGPVIDGWQKIYKKFQIPSTSNDIKITLDCISGDCLFDDVRIFPSDGMMKSYVYDPINMRFVAELDEENYASFFEYDEEGKLTTVKKETERGIMTIKESRSKVKKRN